MPQPNLNKHSHENNMACRMTNHIWIEIPNMDRICRRHFPVHLWDQNHDDIEATGSQ